MSMTTWSWAPMWRARCPRCHAAPPCRPSPTLRSTSTAATVRDAAHCDCPSLFITAQLRSLLCSHLLPSPLQSSPPPPPGTTQSPCLTAPLRPGRTSGVRPSPSRAASTVTPCETLEPLRCSMWTRCLSCMTPMTSSDSPWPIRSGTSTVRSPFPVLVCLRFLLLE